ncbi:MAG: RNA methyltransferase, partial [Acidobacteria bacterium]
ARGARQRREEGLFLVEGPRGLAEALDRAGEVVWVLVAASRAGRPEFAGFVATCHERAIPVQPVRDALLARLAPTEHGPGLLAACRLPESADAPQAAIEAAGAGLLVVTSEIQDPGSLGALVRSAAAFGADALLAAGGADPWNPKAVRASAGAIHDLPVARHADAGAACDPVLARDARRVAAVARGGRDPRAIDWTGPLTLLLGSEVRGLPDALRDGAEPVTIPTTGRVESLSVPIAGSILLAESARARGLAGGSHAGAKRSHR